MRVVVGKIRGAHGIQGELKVEIFDPGSRSLAKGAQVWVGEEPAPRRIVSSRPQIDRMLVRLEGVATRNDAEALQGRDLAMERDALPALPPDEFYLADVVGFLARTTEGEIVGVVEGNMAGGAQEILLVRGASGTAREGKEILIPAVPGIVVSIDVKEKVVVLDPPEGLLDL